MRTKKQADYQTKPSDAESNNQSHTGPLFVVQQHGARSPHYDLRLENRGVLKSWAIPKGPSTNPAKKQLALMTEDHPLSYATFEGIIPEGQYGAGPVIVWDIGTFENMKDTPLAQCIEEGEITILLKGKKLKGGYALIRLASAKKNNAWLLVKMNDKEADRTRDITKELPNSVLSHRPLAKVLP